MNWAAIAKKDFRDARRAKILWGATGIFVFFYAVFLLTASQGNQPAEEAATDAIGGLIFAGAFLLPLVLISMAYLAIAGEREAGSIKYLLGLPNSRFDVLLGKFLGRSAIALTAVGISVVAGAVMLLFQFGTVPGEYLVYVALTAIFSLAFVAIAVGVSAFSASRGKAMAGSIGIYFLFGVLWIVPGVNPQDSVSFLVEDLLGMDAVPELYHFVEQLSPVMAYGAAVQGFVYGAPDDPGSPEFHPAASDTPIYLTDEFMIGILLAWIVVPLAIGYWRFNRAELG
jgi:ABC-2 type transport system permease protein